MMDLGRYLKVGLRWWWLILLSVALSATTSYFYSQGQPRVYAARTTLMVGANITQSTNPNAQELGLSQTLAEMYGQLALRRPITQAVIDRLGLDISPDQLSTMIQTNVIPSAQLLEIFVLDVHPQRAQLIANAIGEELILQSPAGASSQQERDKFIRTQLEELQTKIEDTDNKIKDLENALSGLTSAAEISEAQANLTQLEKLKNDYQVNYNQFLSNVSESSINRLAIFEPATEPTAPVSPNVKTNVLIAAAAGLILALSAIVLLEFFNDTVVWQQGETQSVLGISVLGAIGKMALSTGKIISRDKLWSRESNMLRNVRDSIFLAAEQRTLSTLLITSTTSGEGKSFLCANLAATIASPSSNLAAVINSSGSRVILVDADLRKPSLHEIFDMPNVLGLADLLAVPEAIGESMLKKALKPTGIDNLRLLPAGRNPLDPGSMVNSPRFLRMLDHLKNQADLVIIDSGPILEVVESKKIANVVDGVVLLVTDGRTRIKPLQRTIDFFRHKQDSNLLGVVFNRVRLLSTYNYRSAGPYASTLKSDASKNSKQASRWAKVWPFARSQSSENMMLSLAEIADYLGVSNETAYRWCEQGRISAVKTGRSWAVRLEDLNEFVGAYQSSVAEMNIPAPASTARSKSANGQEGHEPEASDTRR